MKAIVLFWAAIALVLYAYAGYPLLAAWLAYCRGRAPDAAPAEVERAWPPLTVVVAAFNEQARIAARIHDILAQDYPRDRLQVLVVSDGSRDGTAAAARAATQGDTRMTVLELERNVGKACALNAAVAQVDTGLVAFADARQSYAPGALRALVAAFDDPCVGAVSGELVIGAARDPGHGPPGAIVPATSGVGLYWRMEKRLRSDEAQLGWLHGVSGAIHAMRSALFQPMPAGTLLDDMWLPLHVALRGHRVWMARDAIAHDSASAHAGEEFARKLRTLAGNWQLLARMPVLLLPWRNRLFLPWVSHKLLRLVVPWALLLALVASARAPGGFYRLALYAQLACYLAAFAGLVLPRLAQRVPLLPAAGTFVMLNAAALLSLPASLLPDPSRLWRKH